MSNYVHDDENDDSDENDDCTGRVVIELQLPDKNE